MNIFKEWCDKHAPAWYEEYKDALVTYDNTVYVVNQSVKEFAEKSHRPCHHLGFPVARVKKQVILLPGAVMHMGPYLPKVSLHSHGAWMVTCDKDVLGGAVVGTMPQTGTIVALSHLDFFAGIGTVVHPDATQEYHAITVLTDVGSFVRQDIH